ncbi:acyltransferase [Methylobacterium sp. J-001]|uniref:acyltransferase n=1 Tax=unclassified Methylobacterium TaxID=2615210 RepID=UPI001FB9D2EA|nr:MULTISPECIES: acyltransferase [unclassified Methylobacterium]MCJ2094246.1 acyltransferase [Methylobacterium sp. J-072]MCJ2118537.1 acyltransferase [Methylobacterium sp. J-001]
MLDRIRRLDDDKRFPLDHQSEWRRAAEPGQARPRGNHVWIANQATLLKGSTIGDNAIIGAHAVVTGVLPPHCMAAGNPARIVREDVIWRSDLI